MFTLVLILAVSLSISFVCSLLEACVLSVGNTDVAAIERKSPATGKVWRGFKRRAYEVVAVKEVSENR